MPNSNNESFGTTCLVVGCRVRIPYGTWIVASTDPNAPTFYKASVSAPVVQIEPQADGTDWVWWSASGGFLRAGVWDGSRLLPIEGWQPKSTVREGPRPPKELRPPRKCRRCEAMIESPVSSKHKYCSAKCQEAAARARAAAKGYYKPCPVRGCKRRGFCVKHYPHTHRARAALWGVEYTVIVPTLVFDRDGWTCGICSGPVVPSLKHPDLMSASLDHIIPLSRGGGHVWENVQCAHLICNIRKSNR